MKDQRRGGGGAQLMGKDGKDKKKEKKKKREWETSWEKLEREERNDAE